MKKLSILLLSACALSLLACASACQQKPSDNSSSSQSSQESTSATPDTPIKYTFKVLAGNRAALSESNLFITVYDQENKKVAALGLDDSGERTKQLLPDVYTVYLEDENGEKLYSTVTTASNDEPILLYWMQEASSGAGKMNEQYQIGEGYYNVPLEEGKQVFYAFMPSSTGTYRISSIGNADVMFREYAASEVYVNPDPIATRDDSTDAGVNFVYNFQVSQSEMESLNDNGDYKIYFSVSYSSKATDFSATSTMIFVEYVNGEYTEGDDGIVYETITLTKADEALYDGNGNVVPFGAQAGTLTPISYGANLVYNDSDRYYHLENENGPVVVMPFTVTPERLLDVPFNKVGNPDPNDPSDNANPATLHLTFEDLDNNKVVVKEYNTLINEVYPSAVNADGMYPLTEEMREFLYQYVVVAENDISVQNIPKELRWKAPLYYYETGEAEDDRPDLSDWTGAMATSGAGTKNNPFVLSDMGDYCAPFGSVSGEVYYTYTATADGYLNISSTDSKAVIFFLYEHVIANGDNVSSRSENGEVIGNSEYLLEITAGGVVSIQVSTSDWQTAKIPFSLSYLAEKPVDESLGSKANPYELSLGETTAVAPVGTFSLYYAFTPTTTAKYTIYSLDDSGESVFIYLYDSNFKTLKRSTGNSGYTGEGYGIGYNMQAGVTYYVEVSKGVGEGFTLVFNTQK